MRGKYIVLEGGNGAGLTTQVALLVQRLNDSGRETVAVEEPGGSEFAHRLSNLIKHGPERSAKTNVLAFNASRAETIRAIEERLSNGIWVVADRSYLSTIVYQGYGEGQDIESIRQICEYAIGETRPDQVIVLTVSPEIAAERLENRTARGAGGDYFEDMNSQFHDRVREGYRRETQLAGYPLIDGTGTAEEVAKSIWQQVQPLLKSNYAPSRQKSGGLTAPTQVAESNTAQLEIVSDLAQTRMLLRQPEDLSVSTEVVDYTSRDDQGQYNYYTPGTLDEESTQLYNQSLQAIFDTYSRMVHVLTNYLRQNAEAADKHDETSYRQEALRVAQAILPVATTSSISIPSAQLTAPAAALNRDELAEISHLAPQLAIDEDLLVHSLDFGNPVTLNHAFPRNELDVLPYIFYGSSPLSMHELSSAIADWPISRKIDTLQAYFAKRDKIALEQLTYGWDIVADYTTFRSLARVKAGTLTPQHLTPRYGFEMPSLIEDAGLEELFEKAYEMSFLLYDILMQRGFRQEAEYSTLWGHKMRFRFAHTAQQLAPLLAGSDLPLLMSIKERLAEVHPLLVESLSQSPSTS